jgi:hypothetical protein
MGVASYLLIIRMMIKAVEDLSLTAFLFLLRRYDVRGRKTQEKDILSDTSEF